MLFRVKPQVPLPTALRKLFEDPEVSFVGQDIHAELPQELAQTYGLVIAPGSLTLPLTLTRTRTRTRTLILILTLTLTLTLILTLTLTLTLTPTPTLTLSQAASSSSRAGRAPWAA